jgi:hypothetical protein
VAAPAVRAGVDRGGRSVSSPRVNVSQACRTRRVRSRRDCLSSREPERPRSAAGSGTSHHVARHDHRAGSHARRATAAVNLNHEFFTLLSRNLTPPDLATHIFRPSRTRLNERDRTLACMLDDISTRGTKC